MRVVLALLLLTVGFSAAAQTGAKRLGCVTPQAMMELGADLPQVRRTIDRGDPLTLVAIGSSSTAGAGASAEDRTYPARLETHLRVLYPDLAVRVVNKGVNGEEAPQMIARFQRDVAAESPVLVVWQVGANAVLQSDRIERYRAIIREGVRRLRDWGHDVVLMDPQYAPKIVEVPDHLDMLKIIADVARSERVGRLRRFDIMRHWQEVAGMGRARMLSEDGLHMTDASYDCLARALAKSIALAVRETHPIVR
ncbi:MAG: SGNH/GDSL hydrolase family protein [Alphaproteobacteria bacterium]|nr:SGNH/GDSL hydrolase family protein [Alphaproteobacteria bacterium]